MAEPPDIKDQQGPWDEIVNRIILLTPFVILLAGTGYLIYTGSISVGQVTISGTIPVRPIALGVGVLLGFTWLLALAKFYGLAPVTWLGEKLHNIAKNYNPDQ